MTPADVRRILGTDPARTALLFDFDGTLAPLVDDPAEAVAVEGAHSLLRDLAGRFARVAVLSGRPLAFLDRHFDPVIDLSAVYGLESRVSGHMSEHPEAGRWKGVVAAVVAAGGVPDGIGLESKTVSLTVHYRECPDRAEDARSWAAAVAERTGLELRDAKASVELHPPVPVTKGHAVREFARGCTAVAYVGDDVGDLPAFSAVDALAVEGTTAVKVAAGGPEMPPEIAAAADLVVAGPAAVVDLFAPLAHRAEVAE